MGLTHYCLVMSYGIMDFVNIVSGNGLSAIWYDTTTWTNADCQMDPWEQTSFLIKILAFWFKKKHFKMSSVDCNHFVWTWVYEVPIQVAEAALVNSLN